MKARIASVALGAATGLGLWLWATAPTPPPRIVVVNEDGTLEEVQNCASGCNAPHASELVPLAEADFLEARDAWARAELGATTPELDLLLFHGADTEFWLSELGPGPLDAAHLGLLERELARDEATVEFRLVDRQGHIRGTVPPTTVKLREKNHLRFHGTGSLGVFETNGRTRRVGMTHLWSRW